jgi:ATP-dependent exoDNAse (exonuclease V) beta subunit
MYYRGISGSRLFSEDFGGAAERGSAIHAEYEKIGWIDPSSAENDLERALVRPSENAVLWREKSFELFADGEWISGCFDRVVFTEEGGEKRAMIYDFKTNRRHSGESVEKFIQRMDETYSAQMSSYRRALARLSGIPVERISSQLLLHEVGGVSRAVAGA